MLPPWMLGGAWSKTLAGNLGCGAAWNLCRWEFGFWFGHYGDQLQAGITLGPASAHAYWWWL
tara:strand:- start:564 stop:749 length:186 start_codon:yes stop_codon:yes gene_type:complete